MPKEKPKWEPVWGTKIKCETRRIYHPHKNVWNTHWKETSRNPWKCFEGNWLTIALKTSVCFLLSDFEKGFRIHKLYFPLTGGGGAGMSFSSPLPQMLLSKLLALFAYQWPLKRDTQHPVPGKVSCSQRCEQQVMGNYGLRLLSLVQTIGHSNGHRQIHPCGQVDQGLSWEKGVGKPVKRSNYQHQTHHFPHCC